MEVVVLPERGANDQMGRRRVEEHATDQTNLGGLLWQVDIWGNDKLNQPTIIGTEGGKLPTVDIRRTVQINAQDPPRREREHQDIVCNLCRYKVRGEGELELHPLHIEDG